MRRKLLTTASYAPTLRCLLLVPLLFFADTESNSKMLRLLLAKRSVGSTVAVNGSAAIACVEADSGRFQLVFMDSTMPVMVPPTTFAVFCLVVAIDGI